MGDSAHIVCPHCAQVNRVPLSRLGDGAKCGACRAPLFDGHPSAVTGAQFNTHIQRNDIPVIVDFWAAWCGPCKMMAPVYEQTARRLEPRARFLKVDTEAEQGLAARYSVRSIPTLAAFKGGREVDRVAGALGAADFERWVMRFI